MKTFLKVATWLAAVFFGLFIWNVAPDYRPIVTWVLPMAITCYVLSFMVQTTIRRLVSGELTELRHQMDAAADSLAMLDRKVTALLKDALEQRRLR